MVRVPGKLWGVVAAVAIMTVTPASVDTNRIAAFQMNDACAAGTCWKGYNADCIIDGHKTEGACDGATAGCHPKPQ